MLAPGKEAAVKSLVAAYENESIAQAQYKVFAVKADAEGLPGAASLFRAAARAEQVHANNHARVIRQMGGEAVANIPQVQPRTTAENLKTALCSEQYEIDTLYPAFLRQSTSLFDAAAVRTFNWAIEAEKTHARLYADAIAQMEAGTADAWTKAERDFYVCRLCGHTAETREADNCPVCNYAWENFEIVR
jgi:rubrerythrin